MKSIYSAFPRVNGTLPRNNSEIQYSVMEKYPRDLSANRFSISRDGRKVFETAEKDSLLPYLEWFINNEALDRLTHYYQLHSAVVARNGRAFILPGDSGSGKTTLVLGLLMNGFRYLSDEFALIDPKTLQVVPFPRNLYIYKKIEKLSRTLSQVRSGPERALSLRCTESRFSVLFHVPDELKGEVSPVRYVIFPKYCPGERPQLTKITRGSALLGMVKSSLNFLDHRELAIHTLTELLQHVECFSLTTGHLQESVDLLLDLSVHAR